MNIDITLVLTLYVVLLVSLVFHEAAHALFAKWGGDLTAYLGGQVTLNPVPHIRREPMGTVFLPLIVLLVSNATMCFGYASTPIDPVWAHKHPRKAAAMSAAGPLANFVLAGIALGVLAILVQQDLARVQIGRGILDSVVPLRAVDGPLFATCRIATTFLFLNLLLGIFNLYPFPPLDGAGVLQGLFPKATRPYFNLFQTVPLLWLGGLLIVWNTILYPLGWVFYQLLDWIE